MLRITTLYRALYALAAVVILSATAVQVNASTVYVRGTGSPYYKIDNSGSFTQITNRTTAGSDMWYWVDVSSGSTITFSAQPNGSNPMTVSFDSSKDSYFYFTSSAIINLTYAKENNYCAYFTPNSNWTQANAIFKCYTWKDNSTNNSWPGQLMTNVGSNSNGNIYVYVHTASWAPVNAIFNRCDPSTGNKWNQTGDLTFTNQGYYVVPSGAWDGSSITPATTYVVNNWPTKNVLYFISNNGGNWSINGSDAMSTSDHTSFTITKNMSADDLFFFAHEAGSWEAVNSWRYTTANSGNETIEPRTSSNPYTATKGGSNCYKIPTTGTWTFTYNYNTNEWYASLQQSTSTATLYIFDPTGDPTVNNTTVTTTEAGTNVTWHKYTVSDVTSSFPKSLAITSHDGNGTATVSAAANAVLYYAYNKYTHQLTAVTSSYTEPGIRLLHWTSSFASSNVEMQSTDGVNFTLNNVTLSNGEYFIFATKVGSDWNSTTRYAHEGGSDQEVVSGTEYTATLNGSKAYKTTSAGVWDFVYNTSNNKWTATKQTITTTVRFHVIDRVRNTTPSLYVYDNNYTALLGTWPGTAGAAPNTETINGETWYTFTASTTEMPMTAIVNLGSSTCQSNDIPISSGGDVYLIFDSSTHDGNNYACTAQTTAPAAAVQYNDFVVYARSTDCARPFVYVWVASGSMPNGTEPVGNWNTTMGYYDNGTWHSGTELPTEIVNGTVWYKLAFHTTATVFNTIVKTKDGTQTSDILNISDPVTYITYNTDGDFYKATSTIAPGSTLYLVGLAGNQKWLADQGMPMTKETGTADDVYTIRNVSIVKNARFGFTTALGSTTEDWAPVTTYRLYPSTADDYYYLSDDKIGDDFASASSVTIEGWALDRDPGWGKSKDFIMSNSGTFDIQINVTQRTMKVVRSHNAIYVMGQINDQVWATNIGTMMRTTDGINYQLNVALASGNSFTLTRQLAEGPNEWSWLNSNERIGPADASGQSFNITSQYVNTPLNLTQDGGGDKSFYMDGVSGNYILEVVIDDDNSLRTITLKPTLDEKSEVLFFLEKTSNVTNPRLKAFDKLKKSDGVTHQTLAYPDPDTDDVNLHFYNQDYTTAHQPEGTITTADGREWWAWTINNPIADIKLYRDESPTSPLESGDNTKGIIWRRAGDLYYTWEDDNTLFNYTKDYFQVGAVGVADCATMIQGHHYIYYTNTSGWTEVHVHMWDRDPETGIDYDHPYPDANGNPSTGYPGPKCTLVGYDADGFEIWMYDFTAAGITPPTHVLFNNGSTDEATKQQSGDFAYNEGASYDYLGMNYKGFSLANIIAKGIVNGPRYDIQDDLVGVWYNEDEETVITYVDEHDQQHTVTVTGALYAKDQNGFLAPDLIASDDQIDYIFRRTDLMSGTGRTRYDQSNWVKIVISPNYASAVAALNTGDNVGKYQVNPDLRQYQGKKIHADNMMATIVDKINPEIHILAIETLSNTEAGNYGNDNLNVYTPGNFLGSQSNGHASYFFVRPKPQEYAYITWAVYDCDGTPSASNPGQFYVPDKQFNPETGTWYNEGDLEGSFAIDWSMQGDQTVIANMQPGQVYQFHALIRYDETKMNANTNAQGAPRRAAAIPHNDGVDNIYTVYPTDVTNSTQGIVTGVQDIKHGAKVVDITFYNIMGVPSPTPHDGVNIIVKTYDNGTKQTVKQVF